jgi:hypothetical protein
MEFGKISFTKHAQELFAALRHEGAVYGKKVYTGATNFNCIKTRGMEVQEEKSSQGRTQT